MNSKLLGVIFLIGLFVFASLACGDAKDAEPGDVDNGAAQAATGKTGVEDGKTPDVADTMIANERLGFDLFKDPTLAESTNGTSCQSCHPYGGMDKSEGAMAKGTLIGAAGTFPKKVEMTFEMLGEVELTLYEMINFCITNPLAGKELAEDDPMMVQLLDFHKMLKPLDFDADALPIIQKNCSPCHVGADASQGDLTDKGKALSQAEKIRGYVESGRMPKGGTLDDMDYLTLIIWATYELDQTI